MRLLANPIIVRMALGVLLSAVAFVVAVVLMRGLRRGIVEADTIPDNLASDDPQFAYSAVIQQLKQQKFELQTEQNTQRRRAKASEYISAALLANLPCGVLLIGPNGLVKQANAAARQLLGCASPLGMNSEELFRDATAVGESGESVRFAEALHDRLQQQLRGTFQVVSGGDAQRDLVISVIPLILPPGEALGIACVIADDSAASELRQQQLLHKELSAEMALELRSSLSTIRECAERLAGGESQSGSLVTDITHELEHLEKVVGGFLAGGPDGRVFAARA